MMMTIMIMRSSRNYFRSSKMLIIYKMDGIFMQKSSHVQFMHVVWNFNSVNPINIETNFSLVWIDSIWIGTSLTFFSSSSSSSLVWIVCFWTFKNLKSQLVNKMDRQISDRAVVIIIQKYSKILKKNEMPHQISEIIWPLCGQ